MQLFRNGMLDTKMKKTNPVAKHLSQLGHGQRVVNRTERHQTGIATIQKTENTFSAKLEFTPSCNNRTATKRTDKTTIAARTALKRTQPLSSVINFSDDS